MTTPQPSFTSFDPHGEVRIYRRHLPHWRQAGATYFITSRQADSIPRHVIEQWQEEDRAWLVAYGIEQWMTPDAWRDRYDRIPEKQRADFERRAASRLHIALDLCAGSCVFKQQDAAELMLEALRFFNGTRWWLGDVVVMPNHFHALVHPLAGFELEDVLQSVKRFVSTELGKRKRKAGSGAFWQKENYDRLVRDQGELQRFRHYIEANPTKAKLSGNDYLLHRADWL